MERLNRGDWGYIGVRADAEIIVDGVSQDITSGGLWGVESDSDRAYLAELTASNCQNSVTSCGHSDSGHGQSVQRLRTSSTRE